MHIYVPEQEERYMTVFNWLSVLASRLRLDAKGRGRGLRGKVQGPRAGGAPKGGREGGCAHTDALFTHDTTRWVR